MKMANGDWKSRRGSKLPPVEDSARSRYLTAQESRRSMSTPPIKVESTSLPSLHRQTSQLAYKPIVVTFVRNGDRFFEGVKVNITQRNMRSWENLLSELSRRIELPAGVRNIYTPEGGHRIKSLSQLEHKKTYVCGSTEPFKRIDYHNIKNPDWKVTKPRISENEVVSVFSLPPCDQSFSSTMSSYRNLDNSMSKWMESSNKSKRTSRRVSQNPKALRLDSVTDSYQESALKSPEEHFNQSMRSLSGLNYSTPASQHKVLMIYRNAPVHSRERVKVYLNRNMIKSWEDAVQIISENLKTINGCLRLYNLDGKEIESLSQLWSAGSNLIAVGKEKFSLSEFLRGVQEHKGSNEEQSKNTVTPPTSGWSGPSLAPIPEPVHSSPKRALLKGRPLPVIQETTPPETEDPSRNQDYLLQIQKATPIEMKDPSKDRESHEENKDVMETAMTETAGTGLDRKSELSEQGQSSGKGQMSSESDILEGQETKDSSIVNTTSSSLQSNEDGTTPGKDTSSPSETSPAIEPSTATAGQDSVATKIQDGKHHTNIESHDGLYLSDNALIAEEKAGMSTSSSDVSLPHRRDSMYVHHHFPPSPSSVELNTPEQSASEFRGRRRGRRRLSLLQELQNGCISRMSDSSSLTDLQISPQRVLPRGHELLLPHTPLSEISGVEQSVVDMVLPRDDCCSDSSLMSESSSNLELPKTRRSIAIQTNYVDDQLHTTVDEAEISSEQDLNISERIRSRKHQKDISLDAPAAASLLHKKARDAYKVGMVIEEGSFAAIKSCSSKEDGRDYLLRVIQKGKVFGKDDKILQEIKIMRMLRNDNVMGVVDYWETSNEHCMVMEPIQGGDLYDAILHCQHFSEVDATSAARQLGHALVYLHANMIVHRSIKPENIFLTLESNRTWSLKLAGFSLATIATEPLTLECGNEYYRAPEMSSGKGYGAKADVWSAGIITYILLSGVMPFNKKKKKKKAGLSLSYPKWYWENISSEARDFVQCLLKVSPSDRYTSSQLLQHSWFKKPLQSSSNHKLSEMLIEHLNAQANLKVAAVLILTETALSPRYSNRRQSKRQMSDQN